MTGSTTGTRTTALTVDLAVLRRALVVVIAGLAALHAVVVPVLAGDPANAVRRVASMGSLDAERAVGTLVAAVLLTACAGLLAVHARLGERWARRRWQVLAAATAFVALDEVATIHEGLDQVLFDVVGDRGPLSFLWVLPYGAAVAALAVAYIPFLRRLPRPLAGRLLLGGGLFVAGAVGFEVLGSLAFDAYGLASVPFLALAGVEEVLELSGAAVVLLALLRHLPADLALRIREGSDG